MRSSRPLIVVAFAVLVFLVHGLASERAAFADAKKDVAAKIKEAMNSFDSLEYEEAKKQLNQALAIAKKGKLDKDPLTAQIHVRLGIVHFAGLQDADAAKAAFAAAVEIDPKVQIEAAYKTPDMQKLLDEARGSGAAPVVKDGGGSCDGVAGIQHAIVDTAPSGAALPIAVELGADVPAVKVAILYRSQGATEFAEVKMTKSGACGYSGAIPASAVAGDVVHYYVAAYNKAGKAIASKGSAGAPNIIEITGGAGAGAADPGDDENPLAKEGDGPKRGGGAASGDGGTVEGGVTVGAKKSSVFIAIVAGSGGGYVTGKTEQQNSDVKCCFAPGLLHLLPEIGFYLTPQMSLSLAARIGFPIGANIDGHSTAAPAGLLRFRYAFGADGDGVQLSGSLGGGIIRNTIKLRDTDPKMDTDIAAIGPLFAGGGVGYIASLGGPLKLTAELSTLAAIPVVDELGSSRLNFGLQVDINVGLLFGF